MHFLSYQIRLKLKKCKIWHIKLTYERTQCFFSRHLKWQKLVSASFLNILYNYRFVLLTFQNRFRFDGSTSTKRRWQGRIQTLRRRSTRGRETGSCRIRFRRFSEFSDSRLFRSVNWWSSRGRRTPSKRRFCRRRRDIRRWSRFRRSRCTTWRTRGFLKKGQTCFKWKCQTCLKLYLIGNRLKG